MRNTQPGRVRKNKTEKGLCSSSRAALVPPPPSPIARLPFALGRSSAHVTAGLWFVFGKNNLAPFSAGTLSGDTHKPPSEMRCSFAAAGELRSKEGGLEVAQVLLHGSLLSSRWYLGRAGGSGLDMKQFGGGVRCKGLFFSFKCYRRERPVSVLQGHVIQGE